MPHKQPYISEANINHISAKRISIIILSWNTKDLLKRCLRSIYDGYTIDTHRYKDINRYKLEIIVVDNGSTDGSVEMLKELQTQNSELRTIFSQSNLGFAKGNNQGIKTANGELVMLLNSDTIVQKGAIEKLVGFYQEQKNKNLAFSPLLLNQDGTIQQQYYLKFPNLWQILFYHNPFLRFLIMKTFLRKLIVNDLRKVQKDEPFELSPLQGAALMAPKEVWQKVGGLDEDYHFLFEDVDWSWRAQKAGVKLFLVPQAKVTHFGGASWQKKNPKVDFNFYCQHFDSFLLFVRKNYGKGKEKIYHRALLLNFFTRGKLKLFGYFLKNKN